MKKIALFLAVYLLSISIFSQDSFRAMTYNVVKFAPTSLADKQDGHRYIYNDIKPDLLMIQEAGINTPNHILDMLNAIENKYLKTSMFTNISNPSDVNLQLAFYNKNILELVAEKAHASTTRNIDQFTFKLKQLDPDGNPIYLEIFVAHLKSSDGSVERTERSNMVDTFITALNTIDNSRFIIFAGDFNLYSSNEPAYIKALEGTAAIKIKDPLNRSCATMPNDGTNYWSSFPTPRDVKYFWQDNANFQDIHTQNPRLSGGGLDDRFDFILTSENLLNQNSNLSYIPNSYKAYGNNGNCLNKEITDVTCTGIYSETTRLHLKNASDHIPVIADFKIKSSSLSNASYTYSNITFKSKNVSSSYIIISVNDKLLDSDLIIYNQLGQIIKIIPIDNISTINNQITIDISGLSNGVYIINTKNNNLQKPLKFIKN